MDARVCGEDREFGADRATQLRFDRLAQLRKCGAVERHRAPEVEPCRPAIAEREQR